jgi:HD-GYP domain-containing protein (c-di-GMP phosphodiesterase class II)
MSSARNERPMESAPQQPSSPSQGVDRAMARLGKEFVFAFHSAMRALQLYPLENQAVQKALSELQSVVAELAGRESGILLRYVGDFCFINDLRLRIDLSTYATYGAVARALRRHAIGQLEIDSSPSREEWTALLTLLLSAPDSVEPFERLQERMFVSSIDRIRVAPEADSPQETGAQESRQVALRTYSESVAVARETMMGVRMGRGVSVRKVKRTLQKIVDQVLNNESSIIGMTALRDYDQYTFAHSVNVCIFSIALGKKLSLSKHQLYELGLGALMHDLGKMKMPIEVTTKPSGLLEDEWKMIREHPTEGMLALLEMSSLGDLPLRAILIAYEHHMKVDLSGYPRSVRPRAPTLFSRIVQITDGFDAATTRRSYQNQPNLPDAVLKEMTENPTRGLDPLLVKAFVSMIGFYPVGSAVILDSYELAIVIGPSTRPEALHRPVVRVIFDELGIPLSPPRLLDLTENDPATGEPLRTIIKTTDPERYGIDVRNYIV